MREKSFWLDFQVFIRRAPISWLFRFFSWCFFLITLVRKLFLRTFCCFSASVPVISVGSVTVGGAGKTPVLLFLMKKMESFRLGYVSRGYGRAHEEDVLVEASHIVSSHDVGDEAFLLASHVPSLTVAVGSSKKRNVQKLSCLPLDFIFIDDGLQRYDIKAQVEIGVLPDRLLFEKEYLLPLGLLREPISRLKAVDLLFVVREGRNRTIDEIQKAAHLLAPIVVVEHSLVTWKTVDGLPCAAPGRDVALLCGIARPDRVIALLEREGYKVVDSLCLGDHESLLLQTCFNWAEEWTAKGASVVVTEKDWSRHVPWPEKWSFCRVCCTELVPVAGEEILKKFIQRFI